MLQICQPLVFSAFARKQSRGDDADLQHGLIHSVIHQTIKINILINQGDKKMARPLLIKRQQRVSYRKSTAKFL
jgi:hypothetical protein